MTTLAVISPIDPGTNSRVTVRVCASQDPAATGAVGEVWWPAMIEQPVLGMQLFDGDFTSAVEPAAANIAIALDVLINSGQFPRIERYDWSGAPVFLYRLVNGLPADLAVMKAQRFASEAGKLALNLSVDQEPFAADVLASDYAGTTGIEGDADLKGQPKPWVFGRCLNVEPVFIDKIDNVFQVSGYGPVQAISAVYERGASFGSSVGNFANYAALVAANIPEGRWGTCLAQGLIRLGAPPAGVITCDVDGDSTSGFLRRTGAIIKEVARRLDLAAKIDADSLDALDAAVARNVGILINQQTSLLDLARRMAAPCNAVAGINLDGRLIMPRPVFGTEQMVLDNQGRQMPPVLGMARRNTSPPYSRIQVGANRSWRVHTLDEVAFFAELIDRGLYVGSTVYREGNIVGSPDKSRWLYINPAPTSGNAPPTWPTTSNAFWSNLEPPLNPVAIGVEEGATNGATLPNLGSGDSGNIKDETGEPIAPEQLFNTALLLTPRGGLENTIPGFGTIPLGQIELPDLGAASEAALRRAEDDTDRLATALATAISEASQTRETLTSAGFYVDEATGQVRISAVEQTRERVSTAEIRLNAAEANINLRATVNYVEQAILAAAIDPTQLVDLDTVFLRLTAAELDIDGLNATVTTLANATELSLVQGRVTNAEQEIDALQGTISTKVDTTTFTALDSRVSSAETTLAAIGDTASIVNALSTVRLVDRDQATNAENDLFALLQGDQTRRDQVAGIAAARQELRTDITRGLQAEAVARLALQVEIGQARASLATESTVRASADSALSQQITQLSASTSNSLGALDAAIVAEQQARVNGDGALAASINSLTATVNNNSAAITNESQARANGDSALAGQINTLTTTVNGNSASISTFATSINGLEARAGVRLDVNGRVSGWVLNNNGNQADFEVVADNFRVWSTGLTSAQAPFEVSNGLVSIRNASIQNAAISTLKIGSEAVTTAQQAYSGLTIGGGPTAIWREIVKFNVNMDFDGSVIVSATFGQIFSAGARFWEARIVIDGAIVASVGGNIAQVGVALSGARSLAAGTRDVRLEWRANDNSVTIPAGAASLTSIRRYR